MKAYDIEIVNDAAHAGEANHGWCFGLPPGIRPEQWPLDPDTGYPLMHGFTLLLPEDFPLKAGEWELQLATQFNPSFRHYKIPRTVVHSFTVYE